MFSMNRATLIGNLGKDPELKTTPQGKYVCSFSLATSENYKDASGNWVDATEWHNIVFWERMAEHAAQYLKKGKKVYIEGRIKTRNYEKDGVKHYMTEIYGQNFIVLETREQGSGQPQRTGTISNNQSSPANEFTTVETEFPGAEEDDIPF